MLFIVYFETAVLSYIGLGLGARGRITAAAASGADLDMDHSKPTDLSSRAPRDRTLHHKLRQAAGSLCQPPGRLKPVPF